MVTMIDYGVGNLFSLVSSLKSLNVQTEITNEKSRILNADKIILPGVGAFGDAADKLFGLGLAEAIIESAKAGKPILGICLGMQLLFDKSYEFGCHHGLGLIPGNIKPISDVIDKNLKIPHIGWNSLTFPKSKKSRLFKYINANDHVYFVHSYHATDCRSDNVIATTDYSVALTAAAEKDNVFGCQFHPEKSGKTGLNILRAFCEI